MAYSVRSLDLEPRPITELVGFVLLVNVVGSAPALVTSTGTAWFESLEKPWFYPPSIAFSIVWTALFTLLGIALWRVWRSDSSGRRLALALFAVQMAFNVAWTPTFFTLQQPLVALGVIAVLLVLVLATLAAFRRVDRTAATLLVPYLLWVVFATALTFEIWRLNG